MISLLELLVFFNQSLYCYSSFPQIITNYRKKSARALGDVYLIGLFNTYSILMFYFYCLPQPISYRISVTVQLISTLILIIHRLYYHLNDRLMPLLVWYLINIIMLIVFIPSAIQNPFKIGNIAGWVVLFLTLINRVPQMIKFYQTKSVKGFNPLFLVVFGFAAILEMAVVLIFGLPIQTFFMALVALIAILVMSYQWLIYKKS